MNITNPFAVKHPVAKANVNAKPKKLGRKTYRDGAYMTFTFGTGMYSIDCYTAGGRFSHNVISTRSSGLAKRTWYDVLRERA